MNNLSITIFIIFEDSFGSSSLQSILQDYVSPFKIKSESKQEVYH
jgi:hypothetical protein